MAGLIIIAGLIFSILSGIAFCPDPQLSVEDRIEMVHNVVRQICNRDSFATLIKCDMFPGTCVDNLL